MIELRLFTLLVCVLASFDNTKPLRAEDRPIRSVASEKMGDLESPDEWLNQAMYHAGTIEDAVFKARAKLLYLKTAVLLAEQGEKEACLQRIAWEKTAILELPDASGLSKGLFVAQLIFAQVQVEDLDGAQKSLGQITNNFSRSDAAKRVAIGLSKSKDYASAKKVANQITSPLGKGRAIGAVASEWVRAGEFDEAKDLLKQLESSNEEAQAYRDVGRTMAELGREMSSPSARAYACLGAAEGKTLVHKNLSGPISDP